MFGNKVRDVRISLANFHYGVRSFFGSLGRHTVNSHLGCEPYGMCAHVI